MLQNPLPQWRKEDVEKLQFIKAIRQNVQKSEAWLEQRKSKLTSSDTGTALGLNPYEKPKSLLFRKCGGPGRAFTGNEATRHGERYEAEAIRIYCRLMNKTNFEFGLIEWDSIDPIRSPNDYPVNPSFLAGSPDGIAIDNDGAEGLIMVECKCPFRRKIEWGECPEQYVPQVRLNMAILGIDKADFIEYVPKEHSGDATPTFNIVRIHQDWEWLRGALRTLRTFWDEVEHWKTVGIEKHPDYEKVAAGPVRRAPSAKKRAEAFVEEDRGSAPKVRFVDDD